MHVFTWASKDMEGVHLKKHKSALGRKKKKATEEADKLLVIGFI